MSLDLMQGEAHMATKSLDNSVDQLNSFLRGELSAVETYSQAIGKLDKSPHRAALGQCLRSHEERARLIANEVRRLGGEPAESSGVWGGFAKLVQGTAGVFGEKSAIAALEEGEDHGRDDYNRDRDELDPAVRTFVETTLIPEQQRTHDAMSTLKHSLKA
jgi:hypothetical protein